MIHHSDGATPERVVSWLTGAFRLSIYKPPKPFVSHFYLCSHSDVPPLYWQIPWEHEDAPTVAQALDILAHKESHEDR